MSGIDLVTLAAMLGHSRIQMVLRYAHPTEQHQAEAMKRLEEFNAVKQVAEWRETQSTRYKFGYSDFLSLSVCDGKSLKSLEARVGIEPTHKGFADLSLSHLGTAPCFLQQFIVTIGSEPLQPAMEWRASKTSCTFAPFMVERRDFILTATLQESGAGDGI
jgi:hypothetical protein